MPTWYDNNIYSFEEIEFRTAAKKLFKSGYGREELRNLLDRALIVHLLIDMEMYDKDAMKLLDVSKPTFILAKEKANLTRKTVSVMKAYAKIDANAAKYHIQLHKARIKEIEAQLQVKPIDYSQVPAHVVMLDDDTATVVDNSVDNVDSGV